MSSDVHWGPSSFLERGIERLRTFTEPLSPAVASPTESHLQDFAAVIENVIVPRLLMTHASAKSSAPIVRHTAVLEFMQLTMQEDPHVAVDYVRGLLDRGVGFDTVLLDLMAPAARELGTRWVHDSSSFVEVTLGVARMHRILREFDGVPAHMWSQAGAGLHALLLPAPGEQHTFGLRLVQEFLLRESWMVSNHPVESLADLKELVRGDHYDVAGLSLSGETMVDPLCAAIRVIRKESANPHIKVIVGGQLFETRCELLDLCGADGYAADAPSCVQKVNSWAADLQTVRV
jgi:MerR family transcriptional regulator, light-induced transcriptional regulator